MPRYDANKLAAEVRSVIELGRHHSHIRPALICRILRSLLWEPSDASGKDWNAPWWSERTLHEAQPAIRHLEQLPAGQMLVWSKDEFPFTNDHIVPRKRLANELVGLDDLSDERILPLLALSVNCLITKADDDDLNRAHLRQTMPDGWKPGDDMWARYQVANIRVVPNPLLPRLIQRVIRGPLR